MLGTKLLCLYEVQSRVQYVSYKHHQCNRAAFFQARLRF